VGEKGNRGNVLNRGVSPPGEPNGVIRAAGWDRSVIRMPCDARGWWVRLVVEEKGSSGVGEVEEDRRGRCRSRRARRMTPMRRRMPKDVEIIMRMVVRVSLLGCKLWVGGEDGDEETEGDMEDICKENCKWKS